MDTKARNQTLLTICEGAILVALAWALSYFKIRLWYQGGSVDLVMVPLLMFAIRRGAGWGVLSGLVLGTIKCFLAGGVALGWASILLDYTVAYAAVGLAGLFRQKPGRMVPAVLLGCFARFVVHYISGVTIYAMYMPEEFMGMTMTSPAIYSALYNGAYMLINTVLALAVLLALKKPLNKFFTGQALR